MGRLTSGERCRRRVAGDIVRVSCCPPSSHGGWGGFGLILGFGSEVKHREDKSPAGK